MQLFTVKLTCRFDVMWHAISFLGWCWRRHQPSLVQSQILLLHCVLCKYAYCALVNRSRSGNKEFERAKNFHSTQPILQTQLKSFWFFDSKQRKIVKGWMKLVSKNILRKVDNTSIFGSIFLNCKYSSNYDSFGSTKLYLLKLQKRLRLFFSSLLLIID